MLISLSPNELHTLLFPACACVNDEIRAHFIRRSANNARAYAIPVSHEFGQRLKPLLPSNKFFVQTIQEEGLIYDVLWDKDEWEHSAERRGFVGGRFLPNDIEHLYIKAKAYRLERIVAELSKLDHFNRRRQDARRLAETLAAKDDESYRAAAKNIGDTFIALGIEVKLYFSLEELVKELDHRNILSNHEQERHNTPQDRTTESQSQQGIDTAREQDSCATGDDSQSCNGAIETGSLEGQGDN